MVSVSGIAASRKRIAPFRLFRPTTIEAVCDLLAQWPDALLHAGGIDLVNRIKGGLAAAAVIALNGVPELKGVRRVGGVIEIGAATTHWHLEHDALLKSSLPSVPDFVAGLGNVRVRAQGTIGGNVMAAEAGYEILALLAALDAELRFISRSDCTRQTVTARAFRPPVHDRNGLLTVIAIPLRSVQVSWDRDLRPTLGLIASLEYTGGRIASGFGALTGCGPVRESIPFEAPLSRRELEASAEAIAERWAARLPAIDIPGGPDRHYCRQVAQVMLRRAIVRMAQAPP